MNEEYLDNLERLAKAADRIANALETLAAAVYPGGPTAGGGDRPGFVRVKQEEGRRLG